MNNQAKSQIIFLRESIKTSSIEQISLLLFLFFLPFQNRSVWPLLPIQICDICLIPAAIFLFQSIRIGTFRNFSAIDKCVAIFFLSQLLSVLFQSNAQVFWHELVTTLYIAILYYIFINYLKTDTNNHIKNCLTAYTVGAILLCLVTIFGWIYSFYTDIDSLFATEYVDYPYFGSIFRATGFFSTPTMLFCYLQLPLYFTFNELLNSSDRKRKTLWSFACILLLLTAVLTFSKSLVITVGLFILLASFRKDKKTRRTANLLFIGFVLCSMLSNHFLFFGFGSQRNEILKHTPFTSNKVVLKTASMEIVESFYFFSKRCSWELVKEHAIFGVGAGNYPQALHGLDQCHFSSLKKLKAFDPHSTYFGVLAENGILGCLILFLCILVIRRIVLKTKLHTTSYNLYPIVSVTILFFLVEGLVTDFQHFRFFWLVIALLSSFVKSQET